jgi:ATP-binding cassette, subfamily B, bacterial
VGIVGGWRRRRRPEPEQTTAAAAGDELTAQLSTFYWEAYDRRLAQTGFWAIARQLPGLIGQAVRLGWEANRRDTVATIGLNVASGVLTGFALLATNGVLEALFAAGPTPARVRAALPSCPRSSWWGWRWPSGPGCRRPPAGPSPGSVPRSTGRSRSVCSISLPRFELAAFDDAEFYDAMQRARDPERSRPRPSCPTSWTA